ncbi:MAG: FAD-dependent monooxygenase [Piscinibacter sp.]|uniref:FAD-dependent oxidoreductase n=1 Tax=Piscinibacter TaxID=1114981 RepID=UPI000FDDC4CC|nr:MULTISPECIES: FAD-dependent oxidoreductase [Piscinibacter]MCW5667547.1 FAD-dependent monooxygenase [Piscinibacter sp.]
MTQRLVRVCVIGAGLAGLCCALAAASRGLRVQLLDQAAEPRALAAHIEVVPNMLRDLVALGVGDDCVRAGFPYRGIDVIDRHGRHLHELPTERLAGPRFPAALGIRHDELHRLLERAALARGVDLRRAARVQAVHDHAGEARVVVERGEPVEADLVVLAAGAGSALPQALFPHALPASELPQSWWYALLPRPVDLDRPLIAHGDAGRRAVLVPVRHDQAGLALTEPSVAPAGSTPAEHLRRALATFAPRLRALAPRLDETTPITRRPARAALLEVPWHRGAVLAVGDCAHALPPHFGQAAAQAVEDARVLADLLDADTGREPLFEAFERRRAERVRRVHEITTTAARWDLQPDSGADLSLLMAKLAQTVAQPA